MSNEHAAGMRAVAAHNIYMDIERVKAETVDWSGVEASGDHLERGSTAQRKYRRDIVKRRALRPT